MIDPNIILRGSQQAQDIQQQNMAQLQDLGGSLGKLFLGRRTNQMRQIEDADQRKAFANNSIFAPQLNEVMKTDAAAALKAQNEQRKLDAEIKGITSKAGLADAQAGKAGAEAGGIRQSAVIQAWRAASADGITGGKMKLAQLLSSGAIDQATHDTMMGQFDQLSTLPADQIPKVAHAQYLASTDPKYSLTTADNVLDNKTSVANSQRTYDASIYGTDVGAATADKNRAQQQDQFDADLYVRQNKPLDYFTAADGTRYAVYANGQGIPVSGPTGMPVKAQLTGKGAGATTIKDQVEFKDQIGKTDLAIDRAGEAINTAKSLLNDPAFGNMSGGFGVIGRNMPGTPAYNAHANLVKLASQIMPSAIESLRGLGAMTDRDLDTALKAYGNFNPNQSEAQLREQINGAIKLLESNKVQLEKQKANRVAALTGSQSAQPAQSQTTKPSARSFFE